MNNNIIAIFAALFFVTAAFSQTEKRNDRITQPLDSFIVKLSRQAKPQIIDARSPEEFAYNHINNALNFNLQSEGYTGDVQLLDKSGPVFIYAINTGRSTALARDLKNKGFTEVYDLQGGIANWIGSGQPYYTSVKRVLSITAYKNIIASNNTVLVDIGSRYCPACKKVRPVLDSIRNENPGKLKIVEIQLEESPQLIAELKTVDVFPYLILYNQGAVTFKKGGLDDLKQEIGAALAKVK